MKRPAPAVIKHAERLKLNPRDIKFVGRKFKQFPSDANRERADQTGQNNLAPTNILPALVIKEQIELDSNQTGAQPTHKVHWLIEPAPAPIPKILEGEKIQHRDQNEQPNAKNEKTLKLHGSLILTYFLFSRHPVKLALLATGQDTKSPRVVLGFFVRLFRENIPRKINLYIHTRNIS